MHFPLSFCKNASPTFSVVHLLHRLYGVDAPRRLLRSSAVCDIRVDNTAMTVDCSSIAHSQTHWRCLHAVTPVNQCHTSAGARRPPRHLASPLT